MGSGGNRSKIVSLESKDENDESVEISFDDAREIPESVIPIQYSRRKSCSKLQRTLIIITVSKVLH